MRRAPERLCSALLWLYPPDFRRRYRGECLQFVRTLATTRPPRQVAWIVARDALRSLPAEWAAALHARRTPAHPHAIRRGEPMTNLLRDLGLACRVLVKSPTFTAAAVLTLALGIGANTAMFTLADAALLRPVQVRDADRLVTWSWTSSYPDYVEYTRRSDLFDGVVAVAGASRVNVAIDGSAELAQATFVSGNAFDVLGVRVIHGRALLPSDDVANGPVVAVAGFDYWKRRFGGDLAVVGRTVRVNGRPATIVGIAERGFRGTSLGTIPSLYLPTGAYNQVQTGFFSRVNALTARGFVWVNVIARLRSGVTAEHAATIMTGVYAQLHPRTDGEPREMLVLAPLAARALGRSAADVRTFVAMLVGVVGLTLLIGCANLANLLLARASVRRREIGVRLALGATRGRIVRQLLAESVVLAAAGGALGLGIAAAALQALSAFQLPGGIAIENLHLEINGTVLAITSVLSLLTGIGFGIMPAFRASRTDVLGALRDASRGSSARSGMRSTLLAAQVAISLVLLAGTGLFARGLSAALATPLGFDPRPVLTASVNLGLARYDEPRATAFFEAALQRVRSLPQVEAAAWGSLVPTRGAMMGQTTIEGYQPRGGTPVTIHGAHVGPGYFGVVGTRLRAGREISADDRPGAPPAAVINEKMAATYWAGRSPIGGRFQMFDTWITVVGVVENTVVRDLGEAPVPHAYLAFDQWLGGENGIATDPAHLFVKSRIEPAALLPLVRDQMRGIDSELPMYDVLPLDDQVASLVMPQRMGVALFGVFSALALALAAVGIYGVASYVASLRTREIGIRMALGATRPAVRRMVLVQGARPILAGIVAGLAMALYGSRLVQAFLLHITPSDPLAFAAATTLLATTAAAASYLPARRAARTEPVTALRDE